MDYAAIKVGGVDMTAASAMAKDGGPAKILLQKDSKEWYEKQMFDKAWRVDTYIGSYFQFKLTRSYHHYDRSMLTQVFRQNHINASFFEILVIISILLLGIFRENQLFIIPAAATFFLLLTMILMAVSALRSWIRGWTVVVLVGIFLLLNYATKHENFYYYNHLYGLDYSSTVKYPPLEDDDTEALKKIENDLNEHQELLTKWSAKNFNEKKKPKAIFIACSGGGSRAALWSFLSLQHLDSLTKGKLMDHSVMITGSSGGMIGASYYRELCLRGLKGESIDPYSEEYRWDMSKDLLNPVVFNLAINDIFIRTKRFEYDGEHYWQDRGYIFEETLNNYSRGLMDQRMGDYASDEMNALVPFMIFSPSIVNDSRRMLVSNMPLSFMTNRPLVQNNREENVEFKSLFKENKADSVRFLSVLMRA